MDLYRENGKENGSYYLGFRVDLREGKPSSVLNPMPIKTQQSSILFGDTTEPIIE